jgi:hypothetical protein
VGIETIYRLDTVEKELLNHNILPEFCTQIAFNEVRGQVAAIDLGDDCYSKIQVSIFSKYFLA